MCTVSWMRQPEGFRLWFNRDEQHDRADALPPAVYDDQSALPWIAPIDPQGKGTWLALNAAGVALGLLNYYPAQRQPAASGERSRGLLIRDLIPQVTQVERMGEALADLDLSVYPAFYLLGWDPEGVCWWIWDEKRLRRVDEAEVRAPITTSSFRPAAVAADRLEHWEHLPRPLAPEAVSAYHRACDPARSAYSVCMEREDARTVSLSEITVTPGEVLYRYQPKGRGPDGWQPATEVELPRSFLTNAL